MSVNNQIRIEKKEGLWFVYDVDVESESQWNDICNVYCGHKGHETLEDAVKCANAYMEDNEVEYGISISTQNE